MKTYTIHIVAHPVGEEHNIVATKCVWGLPVSKQTAWDTFVQLALVLSPYDDEPG